MRAGTRVNAATVMSHLAIVWALLVPGIAAAQLAPEIGYVFPPGAAAGTTVEVQLGGYDWTPDMQLFPHDPRIKLELTGAPTRVMVPEPPYWFGAKGRGYAWPLPREFPARLTIPADVPPGVIRWQVANANGVSPTGVIHISDTPEIVEIDQRTAPQDLPTVPVTISGQIKRIEEVDQYRFRASQTGPLRVELWARRLGSPLHAILTVRDAQGRVLLDVSDTEGRDLLESVLVEAGQDYIVSLHDHDFAGDRSYVYRLQLIPGPVVRATYPAGGKRGTTQAVEFVGLGLQSGSSAIESLTKEVTFPTESTRDTFSYVLETPHGKSQPVTFALSNTPETIAPAAGTPLTVPVAVTSALRERLGREEFTVPLTKDRAWRIAVQSTNFAVPLDLELQVLGPKGQELVMNDDVPGTTDPRLTFTPPEDGNYRLRVTDRSGRSGTRLTAFRLVIEPEPVGVTLTMPPLLSTIIGKPLKVNVALTRTGGFAGPVTWKLVGAPAGFTVPAEVVIPADKAAVEVEILSAATAPAIAGLCQATITYQVGEQTVTQPVGTLVLASIMAPRVKITPEGLDDVRKVHRGSTYLAPLLIERLESYAGDIVLEMTSKQQRHRQGLASDEFTIQPGPTRVEYPIFVPEWMETTKTSRMILNSVVQVPDPSGTMRTLVNKMELRIGILPEGALLKLAHQAGELTARPGEELTIPLSISRAGEFKDPVTVELVREGANADAWEAVSTIWPVEQTSAQVTVKLSPMMSLRGEQTLRFRAHALQNGKWAVASETVIPVEILDAK